MKMTLDTKPKFDEFDVFNSILVEHIKQFSLTPVFHAEHANSLFHVYMNSINHSVRQEYNCRCCAQFLERYGDLVYIDLPSGRARSVFWSLTSKEMDRVPELFKSAVIQMNHELDAIGKATIPFYTEEKALGVATSGGFNHFCVTATKSMEKPCVYQALSIHEVQQKIKQDTELLKTAINKYNPRVISEAMVLINDGVLVRGKEFKNQLEWFSKIHHEFSGIRQHARKHNYALAQATATPVGWCHLSNSVLGTLMDDINDGLRKATIIDRFNEKMNPLNYQRPQVLKQGTIDQAEKLVDQLGIKNSFKRRYATDSDMNYIWKFSPSQPKAGTKRSGTFSALREQPQPHVAASNRVNDISFHKFMKTIKPTDQIEIYCKSNESFAGFLTASDMLAPPILQWDEPNRRNPVSWYHYIAGSAPGIFNCKQNGWNLVKGIIHRPDMWYSAKYHREPASYFIIEGAYDMNNGVNLGLFPEILKPALRDIRGVIEKHSTTNSVQGIKSKGVAGIVCCDNQPVKVRVTSNGVQTVYMIDRWE